MVIENLGLDPDPDPWKWIRIPVWVLKSSILLKGMAEGVKSPQAMFNLFNMRQEELKLRWQNLKAKLKGQSPVKDLTF